MFQPSKKTPTVKRYTWYDNSTPSILDVQDRLSLRTMDAEESSELKGQDYDTPFVTALRATLQSRYFYAILVYFVTAVALFANDFVGGVNEKNKVYFTFAVVHLINAAQFAWSWDEKGFLDWELFPEYINTLEAVLYVFSSTLYGHLYTSTGYSPEFYVCRRLEMVASLLEVVASVGWVAVWYTMFREKFGANLLSVPGRGLNLLDPEFHANWSLIVGAGLYVWYNVRVSRVPDDYEVDSLYVYADAVYVFNAAMYMLSTLRDYGWGDVVAAYMAPEPFLAAGAIAEEKMPLKVGSVVPGGGGGGGGGVGGARVRLMQDGGRDRATAAALAGYDGYDGYDRGRGGTANGNGSGSSSGRSSGTRSTGSGGSGKSTRLAPI